MKKKKKNDEIRSRVMKKLAALRKQLTNVCQSFLYFFLYIMTCALYLNVENIVNVYISKLGQKILSIIENFDDCFEFA